MYKRGGGLVVLYTDVVFSCVCVFFSFKSLHMCMILKKKKKEIVVLR